MPKRKKVSSQIRVTYADGSTATKTPQDFWRPKTHRATRNTDHWRALRREARIRDGHRCVVCKGKKRLECHHLNYQRLGCELLEDVAILCQRCHTAEHKWWVAQGAPWDHPTKKIVIYLRDY